MFVTGLALYWMDLLYYILFQLIHLTSTFFIDSSTSNDSLVHDVKWHAD